MNNTYSKIIEIRWTHLSPRNAEIMARWELGESYTHIAFCMSAKVKSRGCVSSVVAKNRDDGHVAKKRGPLSCRRSDIAPGDCDGHTYCETPIKAYRQTEVDEAIASRARLLEALN